MSRNLILAAFAVLLLVGGLFWASGRLSQTANATVGSVMAENGFTEFRPASKHVPPGALVLVSQSTPLALSLICGSEASLGLSFDAIPSSPTIATAITAALDRDLTLDAQFLSKLKGTGSLEDVQNVTLKLENVRILEISDALVIESLANRSASCREAIKLRLQGDDVVTMVKSALVADVTYEAVLNVEGSAEVSAEAQDDLAASLASKVTSVDGGQVTLAGENLIWGIRDDAVLARYGSSGLPATGSASEEERRVLPSEMPVEEVNIGDQARLEVPGSYRVVRHDVVPLRQIGAMDCWATVFTMIASWKDGQEYQVAEVMEALGSSYLEYWRENTGLPGGHELDFVSRTGMTARPPAAYFLQSYVEMLEDHGPLWIITGDGISSHAKLLVGIFGPTFEEDLASYQKAVFEFIDPATGMYVYQPALEFMEEFEKEARHIVDTQQDEVDLRWQILHL